MQNPLISINTNGILEKEATRVPLDHKNPEHQQIYFQSFRGSQHFDPKQELSFEPGTNEEANFRSDMKRSHDGTGKFYILYNKDREVVGTEGWREIVNIETKGVSYEWSCHLFGAHQKKGHGSKSFDRIVSEILEIKTNNNCLTSCLNPKGEFEGIVVMTGIDNAGVQAITTKAFPGASFLPNKNDGTTMTVLTPSMLTAYSTAHKLYRQFSGNDISDIKTGYGLDNEQSMIGKIQECVRPILNLFYQNHKVAQEDKGVPNKGVPLPQSAINLSL